MSSALAFVFPGQGSQLVGMGRSAYESSPAARAVFDEADRVLGYPLTKICFEGPAEKLNDTTVAQPAILTTSVALFEAMVESVNQKIGRRVTDGSEPRGVLALPEQLRPAFVAGHSLGEFSALVVAGVLPFMQTLRFREPVVPIVANISGLPHPNVSAIPDALVRHLSQRVEWLKSVRFMVERGASTFVEFGGGPVVNGLVKRIADVGLVNVTDNASVAKAIASLRAKAA